MLQILPDQGVFHYNEIMTVIMTDKSAITQVNDVQCYIITARGTTAAGLITHCSKRLCNLIEV